MGLITGVTLKPEIKYEDDKDWEGTECEITEEIDAGAPWFEFVLKLPNGPEYHYFEDANGSRFVKLTAEEVAERDAMLKKKKESTKKTKIPSKVHIF